MKCQWNNYQKMNQDINRQVNINRIILNVWPCMYQHLSPKWPTCSYTAIQYTIHVA